MTDNSTPPEECDRCGGKQLPLTDYGSLRGAYRVRGWRWLCKVCVSAYSGGSADYLGAFHLLYAKLLDIERQLEEAKVKPDLTERKRR